MTVGFETTGLQDHRNLDSLNILYLGTKKVLDKGIMDHMHKAKSRKKEIQLNPSLRPIINNELEY